MSFISTVDFVIPEENYDKVISKFRSELNSPRVKGYLSRPGVRGLFEYIKQISDKAEKVRLQGDIIISLLNVDGYPANPGTDVLGQPDYSSISIPGFVAEFWGGSPPSTLGLLLPYAIEGASFTVWNDAIASGSIKKDGTIISFNNPRPMLYSVGDSLPEMDKITVPVDNKYCVAAPLTVDIILSAIKYVEETELDRQQRAAVIKQLKSRLAYMAL